MSSSYLTTWDYIVFGGVLLISAGIGIYYRFTGGRQKNVEEYMMANSQMGPIPVAFSLMASFMSAITLLGVSSENYMYGTQFILINLSYVIATPIVAYVFLPVFYRLKTLSVYEYLEHRFGRGTRLVASAAFSLQMILYMGIVLYAPALALSAVTGLSKVGAILSIGAVCTFYSTIGGMKAVLITDVFQSLLMFAAVYCVIIKGSMDLGGVTEIWRSAEEGGRISFFNFSLDPTVRHTVFTQLFGAIFTYLSLYAVNQAQVQRLLTVRDLKGSQLSLWLSLPILIFLSLSTSLAGLTIYAKYKDCDPLLMKRICSADQLLPLFVVDTLATLPGLTGLFIAGILSGSLSTVSSAINSLAAVSWEDYLHPGIQFLSKLLPRGKSSSMENVLSPGTVSFANKLLAFFYGLVCIGLAFVAEKFTGVLQASLTIFGVVGGPLLALFTMGMMFPFTSQRGVVPAFLLALGLGLWMGFGGPKPPLARLGGGQSCPGFGDNGTSYPVMDCKAESNPSDKPPEEYFYLYRISYQWYTMITFSIALILGVLFSLCCPQREMVDESLLSPAISRIMKPKMKKKSTYSTELSSEAKNNNGNKKGEGESSGESSPSESPTRTKRQLANGQVCDVQVHEEPQSGLGTKL